MKGTVVEERGTEGFGSPRGTAVKVNELDRFWLSDNCGKKRDRGMWVQLKDSCGCERDLGIWVQ